MKISLSTIISTLIGFYKDPIVSITEIEDGVLCVYILDGEGTGSLSYHQKKYWAYNMTSNWSLIFANLNLDFSKSSNNMTPEEIEEAEEQEQIRQYAEMYGYMGM